MIKYTAGGETIIQHILSNSEHYPLPSMNTLYSYFYSNEKVIKSIQESKSITNILVDSGAFTFQQKGIKGLKEYLRRYKSHIRKTCDNPRVNGYFEMDIDQLIGYDEVKSIREELFELTDKIIPVWHKSLGINEYKRMCNDYDYIAFSGVNKEDVHYDNMLQFVNTAHKYEAKVHGLGVGSPRILKSVPFDSVDASSWLKDVRFGTYQSKSTKQGVKKEIKRKYYKQIGYISLLEEARLQKYYKNYWKG